MKIDGAFIRHYANKSVNAVLCERLKKVAGLPGNILIAKHIEQETLANRSTEVGIDFAQSSLNHEPEVLSNVDNSKLGLSKKQA